MPNLPEIAASFTRLSTNNGSSGPDRHQILPSGSTGLDRHQLLPTGTRWADVCDEEDDGPEPADFYVYEDEVVTEACHSPVVNLYCRSCRGYMGCGRLTLREPSAVCLSCRESTEGRWWITNRRYSTVPISNRFDPLLELDD